MKVVLHVARVEEMGLALEGVRWGKPDFSPVMSRVGEEMMGSSSESAAVPAVVLIKAAVCEVQGVAVRWLVVVVELRMAAVGTGM